jgi:hypothetical protein
MILLRLRITKYIVSYPRTLYIRSYGVALSLALHCWFAVSCPTPAYLVSLPPPVVVLLVSPPKAASTPYSSVIHPTQPHAINPHTTLRQSEPSPAHARPPKSKTKPTYTHSIIMDTNMEDVGRSPPPSSVAVQDASSINELDGWISTLMQCKQLNELDVQRLCDKVPSRTRAGVMICGVLLVGGWMQGSGRAEQRSRGSLTVLSDIGERNPSTGVECSTCGM